MDATFGSGGAVTTDFGTRNDIAGGVAIQTDGKIVVSGLSFVGADRSTEDFALARYGPDGSLDPTFGVGGMILTDFGGESDSALGGVVILPNGKIVTSGTVNSDASGTIADFGLARYDADGGLDASFGQGGKVVTNIDDHHGYADSMVLQPDGKIVLGGGCADGLALARYQTDGSLDPAFGNGGIVAGIADGAFANDLALQPDGKLVAAGVATALSSPPDFGDFGVERLSADGTLDPTFGIGGRITTDIGDDDFPPDVAIQADGKIVVAGNSFGNSGGNIVLVRYDPDGSLDTAFGVAGISITAPFVDLVAMALQPDGRIVAGGIAAGTGGVGEDMALARYQGVQAAPAFTFAPQNGPVGWPVSISGTGLTGATAVTFNGVAATFTVDSDTHLTAPVPVGSSSGPISVTTPTGTFTSTESFTVTTVEEGTLPVDEFPVESANGPGPIASTRWDTFFALPNDDAVGRINRRGRVKIFPLPSPFQEPRGIARGRSGRVWFTQTGSHTGGEGIGLIDQGGTIREFECRRGPARSASPKARREARGSPRSDRTGASDR